MHSKIFRRSISKDIILTLSLATIIASLILAGVINRNYMITAEKLFNDNSRESIDNLANILIEPLWNVNSTEIERLINIYIDKDIVAKISVFSNYQTFVRQKDLNEDEQRLTLNRIIKYNGSYVASLEVEFTRRPLIDGSKNILNTILITLLTIIIVIVVLTRLLINRFLGKPLNKLLDAVNAVSKGNYSQRIPQFSQHDINLLIQKFNLMFQQLEERDTQLINSNDEIRDLHLYLNNIIQSMPSAIVVVDEKALVKQLNNSAHSFVDADCISPVGMELWEAFPEFCRFKYAYEEVVKNIKPRIFQKEIFTKHESRFFSVTIFPLSAGVQKGVVFRIDDVTEIEKIEEQLRQAQKMETVGNLAGGLAHDFNNVLGGIVGTISIIKFKMNRNRELKIEDLRDNLEVIEQSGQRAADMVQQLLALSRKAEMTFAKVNLNNSLKHVSKICQNTFDKSVELNFDYSEQPAIVKADPLQIEQVILNLCINSAHAMTIMRAANQLKGGVLTLRVSKLFADKYFCSMHQNAHEGAYWLIAVSDTGVGIEANNLAKIFDPFFTTKSKGKGTGLGLSMVYNIIMQHDGFLDVKSEINIGTTFNIYLPVYDGEDDHSSNPAFEEIYSGEGLVLVVDDEPVIRETAKSILEECGYHVILAENGEEGVAKYREQCAEIDLVVLDMVMPKKSGKEAYLEMKIINPAIKVLLASGFRHDERVEEVLQLGVNAFIQKPFTLAKLSKAVKDILR